VELAVLRFRRVDPGRDRVIPGIAQGPARQLDLAAGRVPPVGRACILARDLEVARLLELIERDADPFGPGEELLADIVHFVLVLEEIAQSQALAKRSVNPQCTPALAQRLDHRLADEHAVADLEQRVIAFQVGRLGEHDVGVPRAVIHEDVHHHDQPQLLEGRQRLLALGQAHHRVLARDKPALRLVRLAAQNGVA
jgi:hypothetical protein